MGFLRWVSADIPPHSFKLRNVLFPHKEPFQYKIGMTEMTNTFPMLFGGGGGGKSTTIWHLNTLIQLT